MADYYCGCCGYNKLPATGTFWCVECLPHLKKPDGSRCFMGPEDRTYFAQWNQECPVALAAEALGAACEGTEGG